MRIGLDIHGVLDHHPEKFIALAKNIRALNNYYQTDNQVFILTGPPIERAEKELIELANKYNNGYQFWDDIWSIVDYIKANNIPHHYVDEKHLWTDKKEDWNRIKGVLAEALRLDLHFDDSIEYAKYFPSGVFCHVERRKA